MFAPFYPRDKITQTSKCENGLRGTFSSYRKKVTLNMISFTSTYYNNRRANKIADMETKLNKWLSS